jgi:hypothetical protein
MAVQPRVFALDVDGEHTLAFESINIREALELCKEARLRADLTLQTSNGIPLWAQIKALGQTGGGRRGRHIWQSKKLNPRRFGG